MQVTLLFFCMSKNKCELDNVSQPDFPPDLTLVGFLWLNVTQFLRFDVSLWVWSVFLVRMDDVFAINIPLLVKLKSSAELRWWGWMRIAITFCRWGQKCISKSNTHQVWSNTHQVWTKKQPFRANRALSRYYSYASARKQIEKQANINISLHRKAREIDWKVQSEKSYRHFLTGWILGE